MPSVPRRFLVRRVGAILAASVSALALLVAPSAEADPLNVVQPVISGSLQVGQTLSVTNGQWSDSSSPITSYSYEWLRCTQSICLVIPGATSSTYTLQSTDNGQSVDADVVATDAEGHTGAEAAPQTFTVGLGSVVAYSFSESVSGQGSLTGAVSMEPDSGLACPGPCGSSYAAGTQVVLTASPAPGETFIGWSGACSGTAPTCSVTLDSDASVTATFSGQATPTGGPAQGGDGELGEGQGGSAAPMPESSADRRSPSSAGAARLLALRAVRERRVRATVACQQTRPCRLSLAVFVSGRHTLIVQRSFIVGAERSTRVSLPLTRAGARLLRRRRRLPIVAVLSPNGSDAAPLSERHLSITA